MRTLIADDNEITRMLLGSVLRRLGHEVHEATGWRQAWNLWKEGEFALIISDWLMAGLDGLEFCRRIRAQARPDYTYILLVTSCPGKTNYLEAMSAGADDFITMPIDTDVLAARLRVAERILGLHAKLRAANTDLEERVLERTAPLASAMQARNEFLSGDVHELQPPCITSWALRSFWRSTSPAPSSTNAAIKLCPAGAGWSPSLIAPSTCPNWPPTL